MIRNASVFKPDRREARSPVDSVNWVTAGYVSPIRNQGSCGSCYAFGTVNKYLLFRLYLSYYIFLYGVIYALFVGYGFWDGLVMYVGMHMKNNRFKYGYLIFPLLDVSFVVIPLLIFACVYKRKYLNRPVQKHENNIDHRKEFLDDKTISRILEHMGKVWGKEIGFSQEV